MGPAHVIIKMVNNTFPEDKVDFEAHNFSGHFELFVCESQGKRSLQVEAKI